MIIDSEPEYAVEVPGRGYSIGSFGMHALGEKPTYYANLDEAKKHKKSLAQHYIDLGCVDVAMTVRVVERRVTVTRGEWVEFVEPLVDLATGGPVMPNKATA